MTQQQSGDFAHTGLVALVVSVLRQIAPDLLPDNAPNPDPFARATIDADHKRDLLQHVYAGGGAVPLFLVGAHLRHMPDGPVTRALSQARSPASLAHKWMRLERFHHARHRVRIALPDDGTNIWHCVRHWQGSTPPTVAENILIAGVMHGLLTLSGAIGLHTRIGNLDLDFTQTPDQKSHLDEDGLSWQITWDNFTATAPAAPLPDPDSVTDHIFALYTQDPSHAWRLVDMAKSLGRSPRSLQRDIKADGHQFSSLLRQARSRIAAQMLAGAENGLADIGYYCGYSDQAHFQRDFKRATNMTPAEYRREMIA